MTVQRIIDAALGGILLVAAATALSLEGFPAGGMLFAGSIALFRLAARP